jgi:hypothetical protein
MVGRKGKAYHFIAQNARYLYTVDCGAMSDVFSADAGTHHRNQTIIEKVPIY